MEAVLRLKVNLLNHLGAEEMEERKKEKKRKEEGDPLPIDFLH